MLWALPLLALVSAQATPSISHCPNGSQTVFLLQHNVTIGRQIRALPTAAVVDCSDHCAASNDCVGVEFLNGNCKVFGAGKEPSMPSAKVLMKSCVKSERVCSSPFHFDLFEQKILVGFAREVVPAEDVQVCMSACLNSFDTFGFECESAMFYPVDQECILNTEDRLDRPDLFADETEDKVIYMDNNCAGSQCYAPYITQYIAVEGKQLENELDRIINVDVDSCQSLCTQRLSLTVNDFNCKSFMYNNRTRTCILSDERSKPLGRGTLINTDGFNYYEKKCFASPNTCRNIPSFTRVPQMILVGFAAFVMENVPSVTMCLDQCTKYVPLSSLPFQVQVNNGASFSGVIFVKNKYDTCRVEVANSNSATLVLGLPRDFGMRPISLEGLEETTSKPDGKRNEKAERVKDEREEFRQKRQAAESRDCGLIDMLNGTYKTTVVIQTNNLGIPGLVTSMDQLYEVSCDYSSMLGGKVQAGYNMTVLGPEPNLIQPRGKIELGNPVFMQLVSGDGEQPVVQAKLGDILELRWEIMAMDDELDFFVKDCFAEPGVGAKAEEKLQLIQGGCPTPAVAQKLIPGPIEVQSTSVKVARMQAFRFDSSSSVRVTCELDICKGDCTPVECGLTGGQRQSWGRKKRESENSVVEYETARYRVPKHTRATTSIVIIDPLQQVQEPVSLARASAIDFTREEAEEIPVSTAGQMCLAKPTLIGVFGLLLTLTSVQAIVVIQYLVKRLYSSTKL